MAIAESGGPAPYAPPSAIVAVVEAFRNRTIPTPLTLDTLVRIGITQALAPRTMQALKQLDLLTPEGNPSEELQALRRAASDEFQERFAAILRAAYAPIFAFAEPAEASPERIRDLFRGYEPIGQQGRMVTLFLGLCEFAGIIEPGQRRAAEPITRPRTSASRSQPSARQRVERQRADRQPNDGTSSLRSGKRIPPAIAAFLQELPDEGQGWTQDAHDRFISTFTTLVDFSFPIVRNGNQTPEVQQ